MPPEGIATPKPPPKFEAPAFPAYWPDWNKWGKFQKMPLWKAVALSLRIRPATIAIRAYKSCSAAHSAEHSSRLALARNSQSSVEDARYILQISNDPAGGINKHDKIIDMRSFVQWASQTGIWIPDEMIVLWGKSSASIADAQADKPMSLQTKKAAEGNAVRSAAMLLLALVATFKHDDLGSDAVIAEGVASLKQAQKTLFSLKPHIQKAAKILDLSLSPKTIDKYLEKACDVIDPSWGTRVKSQTSGIPSKS